MAKTSKSEKERIKNQKARKAEDRVREAAEAAAHSRVNPVVVGFVTAPAATFSSIASSQQVRRAERWGKILRDPGYGDENPMG